MLNSNPEIWTLQYKDVLKPSITVSSDYKIMMSLTSLERYPVDSCQGNPFKKVSLLFKFDVHSSSITG